MANPNKTSATDNYYGESHFRNFPSIKQGLKVHTEMDESKVHPSRIQKREVSLKSGMADSSMKYQEAKKIKRKGHKLEHTLSVGEDVTEPEEG